MSVIHICNTFFESELESSVFENSKGSKKSLIERFRSSPVVSQLQFLPLLYAGKEDVILVSDLPENPDPRLQLLETAKIKGNIEHWGSSLSIAEWAKTREIPYSIPDWDIVRKINSKVFSFQKSSPLTRSELLFDASQVQSWIEKTPGPKVMKTSFGFSGKGHFHFWKKRNLNTYLQKEFSQNLPVIGEPWVERVFDFSTQWHLSPEKIEFLGAVFLENRIDGTYLATISGKNFGKYEWALQEHLSIVSSLLKEVLCLGFSGNLGVDAFVYLEEGKEKLRPIVEINGRKTFGWLALQVQQKDFPGNVLRLSFEKTNLGPLPTKISIDGKQKEFLFNIKLVKN